MSDVPAATSEPAGCGRKLEGADRWALGGLAVWAALVFVGVAIVMVREATTLGYPVARILIEDQFKSVGDGHLLPRAGEVLTPAFAVIFMAPVFWLHQMAYFPLADLLGSAHAITIERFIQLITYLLGTPLVYRLLRHGKADRWVAIVLAAAYAISPFAINRMLLCNSLPPAVFLLWSELGRIENRPRVCLAGLILATFSYPLTGFSAVLLAFQAYRLGSYSQRPENMRILLATAGALAIVHFGVLGLWPTAQPTLAAHLVTFDDNLGYPVFPFSIGRLWAMPVKLYEIAVFIGGSCLFLLSHPLALAPAIIDLIYCAGTNKGIRDHTMALSSIGLLTVLGVRAGLVAGGTPWRNRALVAGALFATVYGYLMAGPNGLITLARAPDPPRPHLADIAACVAPGQKRCVVFPDLYAGFVGHCEQVATYEPADLEDLRIDDDATTVFVAPTRLDYNPKGRPYGTPESKRRTLARLAARIRSGELHATTCSPWFVLIRSASSAPSDPSAADLLEHPSE